MAVLLPVPYRCCHHQTAAEVMGVIDDTVRAQRQASMRTSCGRCSDHAGEVTCIAGAA
jgi:hypothetical protein